MYAIGLNSFGGPEVLEEVQLDEPHAGAGEVRIKVQAAGVNPIDMLIRSGRMGEAHELVQPPLVPGMDVAGVVDELGPDLPEWCTLQVGDRVSAVIVCDHTHGGYSQYVTAPVLSVTRSPEGLDAVHSASFLMNALTAWGSLRALGLRRGQTLGVTGATGALGGYLVQLAHFRGIRVVAQASGEDVELVRGFGADEVVDRDSGAEGFLEFAPEGLDAVADAASLHGDILPAIRKGGAISIYRPWQGDEPQGIRLWHNIVMKDALEHEAIFELARLVERGELDTRVAETYPAREAARAHQRMAEGHLRGRLVLTFDE